MSIDPQRQWKTMFNDARDNLHDLPDVLLKAHRALERLDAEMASANAKRPDPVAVERKLVADLRVAAHQAKPAWPDVATVRETRTATDDHDLRTQVLDRARTETAGDLLSLIHDSAAVIVTDYLRPVHDRLVAAFEAAAAILPEAPTTDVLMRAPDEVRKTWLGLDDDVSRYSRVVATAARLNRLTPVQHDTSGEFASLTNLVDIWPDWQIGLTPPWESTDPRLTRLAIIRAGGRMWLPKSADRDAAWWAKYGAQVEQARGNRFALEGFRAVGG